MWSSKWSKMATANCSLCDQKFNYQAKRKQFDSWNRELLSGVTLIILSNTYFIVWSLPELSPLRFDWSKSFECLRRRCQHRLKRWPMKMGFWGVIWINVYGGPRWICRKVVPLHIGRFLWAHTRKNRPKFQRFKKGSDHTNFTVDSFCR